MIRGCIPLMLILLGVSIQPLVAQEEVQTREREHVQLRNDCRLAVQVLTHGPPAQAIRRT